MEDGNRGSALHPIGFSEEIDGKKETRFQEVMAENVSDTLKIPERPGEPNKSKGG